MIFWFEMARKSPITFWPIFIAVDQHGFKMLSARFLSRTRPYLAKKCLFVAGMKNRFTPPTIEGVFLRLRPVTLADSPYIYGLRINPAYNRHLSQVKGTVAHQRSWIEKYKIREAIGQEIYYIIEHRTTHIPCGTVRLYDIKSDVFTWGSWILDENKPPKAALESAILSFGIGFGDLDRDLAIFDVRHENSHALAFYYRFGARQTGADNVNVYFELSRRQFKAFRERYMRILNLEKQK